MATSAYNNFISSMKSYGWNEYRDGVGYRVELIPQMGESEKDQLHEMMCAVNKPSWVEVEVLDAIGSEKCLKTLFQWLSTNDYVCRICSLAALHKRGLVTDADAERVVLACLPSTTILNGMTHVFAWAIKLNTQKIKDMMLWCTMNGREDVVRVHAAARVHFMYGKSKAPFDMNFGDFYREFGDDKKCQQAYEKLCREIQDSPN